MNLRAIRLRLKYQARALMGRAPNILILIALRPALEIRMSCHMNPIMMAAPNKHAQRKCSAVSSLY